MGWSVDLVDRPKKPAPEEVMMAWAREWAKEGVKADWQKQMPPKGFVVLPRRWVVERTIAWISHNRRMAKDYEGLCSTGEAFIHASMTRLMVRRLALAWGFPDRLSPGTRVSKGKEKAEAARDPGPYSR